MTHKSDHLHQAYINGAWVGVSGRERLQLINPAYGTELGTLALGNESDIDRAVGAARAAFPSWSLSSAEERIAALERLQAAYEVRAGAMGRALCAEIGCPIMLCDGAQVAAGRMQIDMHKRAIANVDFHCLQGTTLIRKEPIGVAGLITPWNWPFNLILAKIIPALAAGCTMVLKPSEVAPMAAVLVSEAVAEAQLPEGVFNMVPGLGHEAGAALVSHPDVDMVSFTGSVNGGIAVARGAAGTVKRVHQELGGKSANIILDDCDVEPAIRFGVERCFINSGQSCNAPTRLLVPNHLAERAAEIAAAAAQTTNLGDPSDPATSKGPVANAVQFRSVRNHVQRGLTEGARLVAGGLDRPAGLADGYYVRPTVFDRVSPKASIAQEEIFGPVLVILSYDTDDDAIRIANGTSFGLAAMVQTGDRERGRKMAKRLRAGMVGLNYPPSDFAAPFGGYSRSGNGREYGKWGIDAYLETKAVLGWVSQ